MEKRYVKSIHKNRFVYDFYVLWVMWVCVDGGRFYVVAVGYIRRRSGYPRGVPNPCACGVWGQLYVHTRGALMAINNNGHGVPN